MTPLQWDALFLRLMGHLGEVVCADPWGVGQQLSLCYPQLPLVIRVELFRSLHHHLLPLMSPLGLEVKASLRKSLRELLRESPKASLRGSLKGWRPTVCYFRPPLKFRWVPLHFLREPLQSLCHYFRLMGRVFGESFLARS